MRSKRASDEVAREQSRSTAGYNTNSHSSPHAGNGKSTGISLGDDLHALEQTFMMKCLAQELTAIGTAMTNDQRLGSKVGQSQRIFSCERMALGKDCQIVDLVSALRKHCATDQPRT